MNKADANKRPAQRCGLVRDRGRSRGFTLIELLVVIAIIALLVSLLMPSLRHAKDLAKQSICGAHLKQVGTALHLYIPDNEDWMPGYQEGAWHVPDGIVGPDGVRYRRYNRTVLLTFWHADDSRSTPPRGSDGFLGRYTGGGGREISSILSCPAPRRGPTLTEWTFYGTRETTLLWGEVSYALNYAGVCDWDAEATRYVEVPIRRIDRPAQLMYMCDGRRLAIYQTFTDNPEMGTGATPTPRHFGNFQLVFCDGHVDGGPLDMFYQPEYLVNLIITPKG